MSQGLRSLATPTNMQTTQVTIAYKIVINMATNIISEVIFNQFLCKYKKCNGEIMNKIYHIYNIYQPMI